MAPIAQLRQVRRSFLAHGQSLAVLRGIDLVVQTDERLVVTGPSGAGKSTLLAILGMIDDAYEGSYVFDGVPVREAAPAQRADWRLRRLGFAFQDLHLVPSLTATENVMVPAVAADIEEQRARERAEDLLAAAGLTTRLDHRPAQLSGGERRRVAFARALVNRPRLLLVDEPTSELDAASAEGILALLERASVEGAATVAVSHDERVMRWATRRLRLAGGTWDYGST